MTSVDVADIERAAARASLAVAGVAELQPTLRHSLANAAARARRALGSSTPPSEAGIQAEFTPRTGACHIEVRCVLNGERRALDTARDVRESVRSAVGPHMTGHSSQEPLTIVVTVTRITGDRPRAPSRTVFSA